MCSWHRFHAFLLRSAPTNCWPIDWIPFRFGIRSLFCPHIFERGRCLNSGHCTRYSSDLMATKSDYCASSRDCNQIRTAPLRIWAIPLCCLRKQPWAAARFAVSTPRQKCSNCVLTRQPCHTVSRTYFSRTFQLIFWTKTAKSIFSRPSIIAILCGLHSG